MGRIHALGGQRLGWARPKLNAMWTSLTSWIVDPEKRDMLRKTYHPAWTGFQTWAKQECGKIKEKLDAAWTSMDAWIDTNLPNWP